MDVQINKNLNGCIDEKMYQRMDKSINECMESIITFNQLFLFTHTHTYTQIYYDQESGQVHTAHIVVIMLSQHINVGQLQ